MTYRSICGLAILLLLALSPLEAQSKAGPAHPSKLSTPAMHPDAPPESKLLSQLFGLWDAYQTRKNQDGTWSKSTTHSQWRWYPILDGHGIQDDWIKLDASDPSIREVVGTNIRIYNPTDQQWHMAWIDKNNRTLATFTAVNVNGNVVMTGKNAKGRDVKITFFNLTDKEFDWKQEWTFDGGANWVTVTKIHGVRKKKPQP